MSKADKINAISEPINKLCVPVASSAGKTLQDMWELVFGPLGIFVEKKRLIRQKNLEDFKKSLEDKVANIPEEHLCEPSLSIVGPALDASKYYFEEPEIREMFANLLKSSMDDRTSSKVHPSFCEIIKQLSPIDAQNLACFRPDHQAPKIKDRLSISEDISMLELSCFQIFPIAEYQIHSLNHSSYVIIENVFLANPNNSNLQAQSVSIASLLRQGLIAKDNTPFIEDHYYEKFKQTPEYQELLDICAKGHEKILHIAKGTVFPTPLGENFCSICLPDCES